MATVLLMRSHRASLSSDFAEMIKIDFLKKPSAKDFWKKAWAKTLLAFQKLHLFINIIKIK